MILKKCLTILVTVMPLVVHAAIGSGWTDETRSTMISGCVDSITKSMIATYRQQAGLSESDPLPENVQQGVQREIIPELRKTCTCTIDRIIEKHTYQEVEDDLSILKRAGASIGSPNGCPLNL